MWWPSGQRKAQPSAHQRVLGQEEARERGSSSALVGEKQSGVKDRDQGAARTLQGPPAKRAMTWIGQWTRWTHTPAHKKRQQGKGSGLARREQCARPAASPRGQRSFFSQRAVSRESSCTLHTQSNGRVVWRNAFGVEAFCTMSRLFRALERTNGDLLGCLWSLL